MLNSHDPSNHERFLRAILDSSRWLMPDSSGGAHTEVLQIDGELLAKKLAPMASDPAAKRRLGELAREIGDRFLLKRGKIREISMQLVGDRESTVPRSTVSYAFGPVGYNIHPSLEKTRIDVADAVRQLPYFGVGNREDQFAPDFLDALSRAALGDERPLGLARGDPFLIRMDSRGSGRSTVYDIAGSDPYFQGDCGSWRKLRRLQDGIRSEPLSKGMEDRLRPFFDAPITVGWRDLLRYAKGSRHPEFGWGRARELILDAFNRWGDECFLLPEITYYAPDLRISNEDLAQRHQHNGEIVSSLARVLAARLPRSMRQRLSEQEVETLTWDLLEFHHDYPVFRVEPYQGLLSVSMVRMLARFGAGVVSVFSGMRLPERRNTDLSLLLERPVLAASVIEELKPREVKKFLIALAATLTRYERGGAPGVPGRFERVVRTFYTFQERADYHASRQGKVERVLSMVDLWEEENVHLLDELPELAEKLLVYFVMAYRYYVDTGFFADLRPRHAGRDVFIYGIWGYLTDNLLVVLGKDKDGARTAEVRYVDNRDQFKEFRRQEDRDVPVGLARTALRLTSLVSEPSLRRSIGLFADQMQRNRGEARKTPRSIAEKLQTQGLEMLQAVAHDVVSHVFENTRAVVDDTVDDLFEGVRQMGRRLEDKGLLRPEDGD